jgi:protein-L-isoaspartate(D-aspartate) O-methyltransferase
MERFSMSRIDRPVPEQFYREARNLMVDCQVRPSNITDQRLLTAMRGLPREKFLPPALAWRAYHDADVELPHGRVMITPLAIAQLVQLARPVAGERALVIGAGTGYGAALVAACGAETWALEEDDSLRAIAAAALASYEPRVHLAAGKLAEGLPGYAPFDLILLEGGVERLPTQCIAQLQVDGRLVTVLHERGIGRAVIARPGPAGFAYRSVADCHAPLLASFHHKPDFVF